MKIGEDDNSALAENDIVNDLDIDTSAELLSGEELDEDQDNLNEDDAETEEEVGGDTEEPDEAELAAEESEGEPSEDEAPKAEITDETEVILSSGDAVPLSELKQGYFRQADYSRKGQELAEVRSQADKEATRIAGAIERVTEHLKSIIPPMPDDSLLYSQDPNDARTYNIQKHQHEQVQNLIMGLLKEKDEADSAKKALSEGEVQQIRSSEQAKLIDALPDVNLRSNDQMKAFFEEARNTGMEMGFTAQEMSTVMDHRLFKVLHFAKKGMQADTTKVKAKAKLKKVKPTPPKKAVRTDSGQSQRNTAMSRLRKDDSIENAINALLSG